MHLKAVIRIINDKYLKSRYCLDEALRIKKYATEETRIFTIVLPDSNTLTGFVNQLSDINNLEYKNYWKLIIENIYSKLDRLKIDLAEKERLKRFYGIYIDIYEYIIEFIQSIQDSIRLDLRNNKFSNISLPIESYIESYEAQLDKFVNTVAEKLKK